MCLLFVSCAGDILVNGLPKQQATWARQIGYVEQMVRACCFDAWPSLRVSRWETPFASNVVTAAADTLACPVRYIPSHAVLTFACLECTACGGQQAPRYADCVLVCYSCHPCRTFTAATPLWRRHCGSVDASGCHPLSVMHR